MPMHFLCPRCGQSSDDGRADSTPRVCAPCRALEAQPQGESVRLFEPAPAQLPGQLGF